MTRTDAWGRKVAFVQNTNGTWTATAGGLTLTNVTVEEILSTLAAMPPSDMVPAAPPDPV